MGSNTTDNLSFLNNFKNEEHVFIAKEVFKTLGINQDPLYRMSMTYSFDQLKTVVLEEVTKIKNLKKFNENLTNIKSEVLDSKKLNQFFKNPRLLFFTINYISNNLQLSNIEPVTEPKTFLTYLINIEFFEEFRNRHDFHNKIENIKREYLNTIGNKLNLKKYIDDGDFIEWCHNHLTNRSQWGRLNYKNTYPNVALTGEDDIRIKILTYFDVLHTENRDKHEILIKSIKKSWQQKCFRDKGGIKKDYHLPLTKQAKIKLEKLASFNKMSENQILEDLINQKYENEMCDENGKPIY